MGRFLDIIREVQSERVTNIINTCNEGMGLCICTNNVLEHGVAYIWKKLINLNCDVVAVALSKKSTGEPEVFRVFEMGMALSRTKFLPLFAKYWTLYCGDQFTTWANHCDTPIKFNHVCPFGEYCILCMFDMVIWFQNEKVQSLWLANQSQLCSFTGPFWRILYLVHIIFDTVIWLQNEMGQSLWLVKGNCISSLAPSGEYCLLSLFQGKISIWIG